MKKSVLFILFIILATSTLTYSIENILSRDDKHFLGGGKMVVWAPEYPLFLDILILN